MLLNAVFGGRLLSNEINLLFQFITAFSCRVVRNDL